VHTLYGGEEEQAPPSEASPQPSPMEREPESNSDEPDHKHAKEVLSFGEDLGEAGGTAS
jgi:hypothetical protein